MSLYPKAKSLLENLQEPGFQNTIRDLHKKNMARSQLAEMAKTMPHAHPLALRIFKRGFASECTNSTQNLSSPEGISKGILESFLEDARKTEGFVVFDQNLKSFYETLRLHQAQFPNLCFEYEATEGTKTLESLLPILNQLSQAPPPKSIWAVGGGITCDVTGFLAGLLDLPVHYGITTVLAGVDAGVGGKNGVNWAQTKNLLGLIVPPASQTLLANTLVTLPHLQILCGLGEALKHNYLWKIDPREEIQFSELVTYLELNHAKETHPFPMESLCQLALTHSSRKLELVILDPNELHLRKLLNLGHTVGHVLESLGEMGHLQQPIPHGLAVLYGMRFLTLSGRINPPMKWLDFCNRLIQRSRQLKIELRLSENSDSLSQLTHTVAQLLGSDKKREKKEIASSSIPLICPVFGVCSQLPCTESTSKLHFYTSWMGNQTLHVPLPQLTQEIIGFVQQQGNNLT
jgi:3-dehydroquinate synthase